MKAKAFDAELPKTEGGLPIVTLMGNPDMGEGGGYGFLSLVTRGATGVPIKATKAATSGTTGTTNGHSHPIAAGKIETADGHAHPWDGTSASTGIADGHTHTVPESVRKIDAGPMDPDIQSDPGVPRSALDWFSRAFAPLFTMPTLVTKKDPGPTTFETAVMIPKLHDVLWAAQDALHMAIANIVKDEAVTDKGAAINLALAQFSQHVAAQFGALPAIKSADAAEVSRLWATGMLINGKQVINPRNLGKISAARKAMRDALATLDQFENSNHDPVPAIKLDIGDPNMDVQQLMALAEAAATTAGKVAKAANPAITPAELIQVGQAASMEVFKVAVAGPPQPGIPNNILQMQLAQSMGMSGTAKDPMTAMTQAINKIGSLVMKMDQELNGETNEDGTRKVGAVSLREVVVKQGEALATMGVVVRKVAGLPAASAAVVAQPAKTPEADAAKVSVQKGGDAWAGGALDFSNMSVGG